MLCISPPLCPSYPYGHLHHLICLTNLHLHSCYTYTQSHFYHLIFISIHIFILASFLFSISIFILIFILISILISSPSSTSPPSTSLSPSPSLHFHLHPHLYLHLMSHQPPKGNNHNGHILSWLCCLKLGEVKALEGLNLEHLAGFPFPTFQSTSIFS